MVERWIQADPRNRELALELSRYLAQLATRGTVAQPPAALPSAFSTPSPVRPALALSPSKAAAAAAAPRNDPIDRMIGEAQVMLNGPIGGGIGGPMSGLVGGLSPAPAIAPGVSVPFDPPPPPPAVASAPAIIIPSTPDERAARAQFLALQKAQHHRVQIDKCIAAKDVNSAILHIGRAAAAFEAFIQAGGRVRTGDEARDSFDYVVASIPAKAVLPVAVEQTLERVIARMDVAEESEDLPGMPPHPAAAVAPLLAGKVAVLIGGDVREDRKRALQTELGLGELRWIKSTPTNPATKFGSDIKRADVSLVLLAIRWVRHNTGYAVADACTKFKKPLVRLPGGLGSNAVAHEILEQYRAKA